VLSEHGGHGGSAAAPIAQKVLAKYFEKKGIVPPPKPFVTGTRSSREEEDPVVDGDAARAEGEPVPGAEKLPEVPATDAPPDAPPGDAPAPGPGGADGRG
jgi:hypothetical protein